MKTLLIAHRGDTVNYIENTMEAFRSAFHLGADGIECDIHIHRNDLIIVHDYLFDISKEYPTLKNVLDEFGESGRIEIEIKSFTYEIINRLVLILNKYPEIDYEITTSELFLIPEIRKVLPQVSIGAIFQPKVFENWMTDAFIHRKIVEISKTINANVAHIPAVHITQSLVNALHKEGLRIHSHIYGMDTNVLQEMDEYNNFCKLGIDQCTFDNINLLSKLK